MSQPTVRRVGAGEASIVHMGTYRMTQPEARALVDALSRVVVMPPRRKATRAVERCPECGHALSRHNELGYCSVTSPTKGDCMCGSTRATSTRPAVGAPGAS